MPKEGEINPRNTGFAPNPCTPAQEAANWGNVRDSVYNFQNQIGDIENINNVVDGDVTNIVEALEDLQIQINNIGGGGTGITPAYGGLILTLDDAFSIPQATDTLIEYGAAMPSSGVTTATGSGARITIDSDGDYFVWFAGVGQQSSNGVAFTDLWFKLYKNGSEVSPIVRSRNNQMHFAVNDPSQVALHLLGTAGAILSLEEDDYLEVYALGQRGQNGLTNETVFLTDVSDPSTEKEVVITEEDSTYVDAITYEIDYSQLCVIKVGNGS